MESIRIIDGRVVSGHFIFVRDSGILPDVEFLRALGLCGYTPDGGARFPCHYAHILRASDWSAYADDWFYTSYNSAGVGDAVARLGRDYEVLRIAIGDADESFAIKCPSLCEAPSLRENGVQGILLSLPGAESNLAMRFVEQLVMAYRQELDAGGHTHSLDYVVDPNTVE